MNGITAHFQSYLNFATVDGTASGVGTWVMLVGPVLVALLGLYAAYNVLAAIAGGVVRAARRAPRPAVVVATPAPVLPMRPRPEPTREIVLVDSAA